MVLLELELVHVVGDRISLEPRQKGEERNFVDVRLSSLEVLLNEFLDSLLENLMEKAPEFTIL